MTVNKCELETCRYNINKTCISKDEREICMNVIKRVSGKRYDEFLAWNRDKIIETLAEIQQKVLPLAYESDYFCGQLALINRIIPIIKGGGADE